MSAENNVNTDVATAASIDTISRREALQIAALTAVLPWAVSSPAEASPKSFADQRERPFDADWTFYRGDRAEAFEPSFDDASWRKLDLPHDWSIEDLDPQEPAINAVLREADTAPIWASVKDTPRTIGPFEGAPPPLLIAGTRSAGGRHTGYTVGGVGWYRKTFSVDAVAADAQVEVMFDGVFGETDIWLNGHHLGTNVNGYAPIAIDLTPHLVRGGKNVLAVRVANVGMNSRWYSGSGIYRQVWLTVTRATRFKRWGVRVSTQDLSTQRATVELTAQIEQLKPGLKLHVALRDAQGRTVSQGEVPALAETSLSLGITDPRPWSTETPVLYDAECTLSGSNGVIDQLTVPFGIRTLKVTPEQGLMVNGKPTKLCGGCVHHDNGLLGAVAIDRAEERKVELLKARGFNAVRTSHNPPSTSFLAACDRLGMFVVEELFDTWSVPKTPDDYHTYFNEHWRKDLTSVVARDANHPSVIIWSIGNEIPEKYRPLGIESARHMTEEIRRLDPDRPITAGINGWNGSAVTRPDGKADQAATQFLDIAGYNYNHVAYEKEHPKFPARVFLGTESFAKNTDAIWRTVNRNPYVLGDFVWTAMDYLGESGIGMSALEKTDPFQSPYPWFNAFCGDIDLIGQQKPQSLLRDVVWGLQPVTISVERPLPDGAQQFNSEWGWGDELQSWSWSVPEGRPLRVRVFSRGDRVELQLNGRPVGEKALTEANGSQIEFSVPYVPGRLVASVYKDGRLIGKRTLETAGPAASLRLDVDRRSIVARRGDLAFVTVEVVDAQGRIRPDDVRVLQTAVSGPIEIAAFGNANPRGVASFRQPVAKTWHGRALAVLRPTGTAGTATIEVRTDGLRTAIERVRVTSHA